ncbi:DNA polymerase III subunits gamma and tau [Oleiphilus messinensis]|uniref:DNA polymerase III subunit gamma/tau n=1 Tax=Oleiphilus messinensis TaxID=141451 RepID=A0A1Y0IA41_9GAMM|nr:DNA polymerase III subunit gamma/tau [Oleiphilus messinensis]ARU57392.1 DNA polymerase III subunits gamma and tau [Oleiphilus messinensis]
MSYQVLARKWRPKSFAELVGQEHVLKALVHALDSGRLHHAYLFTGTRGVGKTTIGRILAKCLNCEQGVVSAPCGVCSACQEISEGRFVDLIEIDAASRTKVEDMREILDNVQYSPTRGRFKVYLIDEVHMLSQSSFNALLKTLEEPPEHVKFLLATTDPQKLPVTILSRCLQFNLKNMPADKIVSHLQRILNEEQIEGEDNALWMLARAAEGSMRDALSLTDQAIAYCKGLVKEKEVSEMLGTVDQRQVYRLVNYLAGNQPRELLAEVEGLSEYSPDYRNVLEQIISIMHRTTIEQVAPGAIDNARGDQDAVRELASSLSPEDVQLFYQIALVGRQDLALAPDPRAGFEMVLLRMLAFRPNAQHAAEVAAPDSGPVDVDQEPEQKKNSENGILDHSSAVEAQSPEISALREPVSEAPQAVKVAPPSSSVADDSLPPWVTESVPDADPGTAGLQQDNRAQVSSVPKHGIESDEVSSDVRSNSVMSGASRQPNHEDQSNLRQSPPEVASDRVAAEPVIPHQDPDRVVAQPTEIAQPRESAGHHIAESPKRDQSGSDASLPPPELNQPAANTQVKEALEPIPLSEFDWVGDFESLGLTGMTMNIAAHCDWASDGSLVTMRIDVGHHRMLTEVHRKRIVDAVQARLAEPVRIEFLAEQPVSETPMQRRERNRAERLALAVQSIENDQNVQQFIALFDARIMEKTVEPIDPVRQ